MATAIDKSSANGAGLVDWLVMIEESGRRSTLLSLEYRRADFVGRMINIESTSTGELYLCTPSQVLIIFKPLFADASQEAPTRRWEHQALRKSRGQTSPHSVADKKGAFCKKVVVEHAFVDGQSDSDTRESPCNERVAGPDRLQS